MTWQHVQQDVITITWQYGPDVRITASQHGATSCAGGMDQIFAVMLHVGSEINPPVAPYDNPNDSYGCYYITHWHSMGAFQATDAQAPQGEQREGSHQDAQQPPAPPTPTAAASIASAARPGHCGPGVLSFLVLVLLAAMGERAG